jgi:hypothetical protein
VPGLFAVYQPADTPHGSAHENHSAENSHTRGSSSWVLGLRFSRARLARFASRQLRQPGSCGCGRFAQSSKFHSFATRSLPEAAQDHIFSVDRQALSRSTLPLRATFYAARPWVWVTVSDCTLDPGQGRSCLFLNRGSRARRLKRRPCPAPPSLLCHPYHQFRPGPSGVEIRWGIDGPRVLGVRRSHAPTP